MVSPAATGLSGFWQTVQFTCAAPFSTASAALPRLMENPAASTLSSRREDTVSRTSLHCWAGGVSSSSGSGDVFSFTRPADSQSVSRKAAVFGWASTWHPPSVISISPMVPRVNPKPIRLPKISRWVRLSPPYHDAATAITASGSGSSAQSGRKNSRCLSAPP